MYLLLILLLNVPFTGSQSYESAMDNYKKAWSYDSIGNIDKSLDHYLIAHNLIVQTDCTQTIVSIKKNIGSIFNNSSNPDMAIKFYTEALAINKDPYEEIGVKYNIARALKSKGEYDEAMELLLECYNATERPSVRAANIMNELGLLLTDIGQPQEAIKYFDELIYTSKYLADSIKYRGRAYHNIGHTYFKESRFDSAISNYKRALVYNSRLSNQSKAWTLVDLGESYYMNGQFQESITALNEAASLVDLVSSFRYSDIPRLLARSYDSLHESTLAVDNRFLYETTIAAYYSKVNDRSKEEQKMASYQKFVTFQVQQEKDDQIPVWMLILVGTVITILISYGIYRQMKKKSDKNLLEIQAMISQVATE